MWKRLNKGFVNDLRKQLLVWRSLEEAVRVAYEDKVVNDFSARMRGDGGEGGDAPAGGAA